MFRVAALLLLCTVLPAQTWFERQQADDGRWPAARLGGRAVRDLRATALISLALLGNGTSLRNGLHQNQLKRAISWLLGQQDDRGRLWLQTEPDWILDHAMATCALAEAARLSDNSLLRDSVRTALGHLTRHLRRFAPGRIDAELLVWSAMAARAATFWEAARANEAGTAAWDTGARELQAEIVRLRPQVVPTAIRERAATLLLGQLIPGGPDHDQLITPFAADAWPADVDDPLAVFYAACALYQDADSKARLWRPFSRRIAALVLETQGRSPEQGGTWTPRGAFGADGGGACTSAVHMLILELYYRYSRLAVAS